MVAGIDLCLGGDHGCSQICVSTPGSYYCNCERGFQLINTTECEGIIVLLSLQAVCSSNHMYYTQMWMNAPLYLMDTVVSNASIHTDPTTVTVWRDSVFLECFSVKVMKTYLTETFMGENFRGFHSIAAFHRNFSASARSKPQPTFLIGDTKAFSQNVNILRKFSPTNISGCTVLSFYYY